MLLIAYSEPAEIEFLHFFIGAPKRSTRTLQASPTDTSPSGVSGGRS